MKPKYTPMMTQYLEIKEQNQDAIVMFRLGDFYEMFFDDAIIASKDLNIALTGRDAGVEERVPMCGVPFHSVNGYITRLVEKGHKVVIVEQLTDPKESKGIVKRGIIKTVTPGTIMEGELNITNNNFLASLGVFDFCFSIAFCDLTTGEFFTMNVDKNKEKLYNALMSMQVKEILTSSSTDISLFDDLKKQSEVYISIYNDERMKENYKRLFSNIHDLKQIKVASLLLNYLLDTQRRDLDHLQTIEEIKHDHYISMDVYTKRSLDLLESSRSHEKYGSLLWLLDETKSAMGARLLKQWVERPLIIQEEIEERLDIVEMFYDNFIQRESIKEIMKEVYDIERLAARVAYGNVNARDLKWIASSLKVIPELKNQLLSLNHPLAKKLYDRFVDLSSIIELIDQAIVDTPPLSIKEGNMIKEGFSQELDEYRYIKDNGKQWLAQFEQKEKERTGIRGLKIGYNRVFGYYIEITKSYLPQVKEEFNYTRKQSIANAERFITPELKEMEVKILGAQDKMMELEYQLFLQIRDFVKKEVHLIQENAKIMALLDVYQSLATVSSDNRYVRPTFNKKHYLNIENGRHCVIEKVMKNERYIENDVFMDEKKPVLLITGPNMGGKSTYMRQVALIVLMAQIGCFVSASKAQLPVFDQIFTRIGASDDLVSGQSTFMVEMLEANNALRYATDNSLILFDEIGRGTATYDGMAIAQAMIEHIAKNIGCMTLFSTHYHELTYLEETIEGIRNIHAEVKEEKDHIVFLYKIKEGKANKSYGINVARLAKLPESILTRANVILNTLEEGNTTQHLKQVNNQHIVIEKESEVENYLTSLDPLTLSPLDALSTLIELKKMIKED